MRSDLAHGVQYHVDLGKVRRFDAALRLALHDGAIEARRPITFVFDADVVVGAIQGLTFESSAGSPEAIDTKLVVRALLSTTRLGKAHMLRPHLLELDRKLHSWPSTYTPMKEGFYRAHVMQLIEAWGLHHDEEALSDPTELPGLLHNRGFDFFVKVELCFGGTWQQRLNRLMRSGVLSFEPLGPGDRLNALDDNVKAFASQLAQHNRETHNINNLVDAAALSALRQLSQDHPDREFRFYTDTIALRNLFAGPSGSTLVDRSGVSLLRDEDYFLMRVSFPTIGAPAPVGVPPNNAIVHELELLASQLAEFLDVQAPEREIQEAVRRIVVNNVPLPALIDDFFRLKFVRAVVLDRWKTPEGLAEFLPNVSRAFLSDAILDRARLQVRESFQTVSADLSRQVGWLREWKEDCERLAPAIETRRGQIGVLLAQPRLDTDIGLARWGITAALSTEELDEIQQCVRDIVDAGVPTLPLGAQIAMEIADSGAQASHQAYPFVILWFLQQYDRLIMLWRQRSSSTARWSGLNALYLVSLVKSAYSRSLQRLDRSFVDEFEHCMKLAETELDAAPLELKPFALMSKAHVAYWAWKRVHDAVQPIPSERAAAPQVADGLSQRAMRWARLSYSAAAKASAELPRASLEWTFAINHCTYIAFHADMFADERDQYYELLNTQAYALRHYRFADTLATPFTLDARRIIRQRGIDALLNDTALVEERLRCVTALQTAREFLEGAKPWFGDEEVNVHHRQVLVWLRELRV